MKIRLEQQKGLRFVAEVPSGHAFILDGSPKHGGFDSAPSPMEAFLAAAGACTGMDVISLLEKMRVRYSDFRVELWGERAEDHPKFYTSIDVEYHLKASEQDREKIEKAARLSQERYCPAFAHLRDKAEVHWRVIIHEPGD